MVKFLLSYLIIVWFITSCNPLSSTDKGIILYVQEEQIWALDVTANQTRQLTFDEGGNSRVFTPKWSSDGQTFAYKRFSNLWLSDRSGENHREIVEGISRFWWVNTNSLRYCQSENINISCFLYDTTSNKITALKQNSKWWIFAYSPDLQRAFVQEYKLRDEKIHPQNEQYLLDLGTGEKVFKHKIGDEFWTEDPQWAPDGKKVAFTANLSDDTTNGEIFVIDARGENLVRLTNFSDERETSIYPALLQWSPDGEWLAFVVTSRTSNDLVVMKADGSHFKRLNIEWVTLGQSNLPPIWSPDSKEIAFVANQIGQEQGEWGIYKVDIETGNISHLLEVSDPRVWFDWR